ncbi:MAG: hypothetical protein AB7Q97_09765 [Gammaproteobacteria bacterium]
MTDTREGLHLHEAADPSWQENFYFGGWDPDQRAGFGIHLKLIPARQAAQIRAIVMIDGVHATAGRRLPLADVLQYPGYHPRCVEPFRHWHIGLDLDGLPRERMAGYMGLEPIAAPDTPIHVDADLRTALAPIDWAQVGKSGAGSNHYDHAHAWSGTLRIGARSVVAQGLGIRDHSWGPRSLANLEQAWFVAVVFPGAERHVTGLCARRAGQTMGFAFHADTHAVQLLPMPEITVTQGVGEPGGYEAVRIVLPGMDIGTRTQTAIQMPLLADRYLSSNALGSAGTPAGEGFSFVELGRGLSDADVEDMLRRAGAKS